MVCDPSQNNINIAQPPPGPSLPGLGLPFSVPKVPFPDLQLPEGIPEDIIAIVDQITALFPQGIKFIPNTDAAMTGIWDALASLFNQLAPFLGFYNFIQALLNIILCIIDVLCALMNPFALISALIRLFKQCLPDFLSLFPWFALLIMILALILLLIALIEYIINVIAAYIRRIIANIETLTRAITVGDEDAILAAINKLSYLLCLIEQLFSILLAVAALFAVIRPLMSILGRGACSAGGTDPSACCTEDFCPAFISSLPDGQFASTGRLIYFNKISPVIGDPSLSFLSNFVIRDEKWQFIDEEPGAFNFVNIITPSPEHNLIYWPEGESYDGNASINLVPYLLDMNVTINPGQFGNPADSGGQRKMHIRNIIVAEKPTTYPSSWNGGTEVTSAVSGALVLLGGEVFEFDESTADGYSPYFISGIQGTLETLVSVDPSLGSIPAIDDGYNFVDVEYNLRYVHPALVQKGLIVAMCTPETTAESAVLNDEFGDTRSVIDRVGDLPDIGTLDPDRTDGTGTLGCLARALTKFRQNINAQSALVFQQEVEECLNDLKDESVDFYNRGASEAADVFSSDFEIEPEVQFINREIEVTVRLRDKTGTQLAVNVPDEIGDALADTIEANPTFGDITPFVYDGYGDFIAQLTSSEAGAGQITATINGETLKVVLNRDNEELDSQISDRILTYEFVDSTSTAFGSDPADQSNKIRFDDTDIANDGD